jgi:Bacteriocin-protection, YdeI or OmpD-Associated/Domain of unknown function (DUF1905)
MLRFKAEIRKYARQGEKTGWTYVDIPVDLAGKLYPGNRKSFRIQGTLDGLAVKALALIPMGEGHFILPLNTALRKRLRKSAGQTLQLSISRDENPDPVPMPEDFAACLEDEPAARKHFYKLPGSHQKYYIKWINGAKTETTRVKRIAQAVSGLLREMGYGEMLKGK